MAKTTLKPYLKEDILVDIESTEVLTPEEEEIVARGVRTAFCWCFEGEPPPCISEIKQAINKTNPTVSSKLISIGYHR